MNCGMDGDMDFGSVLAQCNTDAKSVLAQFDIDSRFFQLFPNNRDILVVFAYLLVDTQLDSLEEGVTNALFQQIKDNGLEVARIRQFFAGDLAAITFADIASIVRTRASSKMLTLTCMKLAAEISMQPCVLLLHNQFEFASTIEIGRNHGTVCPKKLLLFDTSCGIFVYPLSSRPSRKRARYHVWSIQETSLLGELISSYPDSRAREIALKFMDSTIGSSIPLSKVQKKVYALRSSPLERPGSRLLRRQNSHYWRSVADTPIHACASCNILTFKDCRYKLTSVGVSTLGGLRGGALTIDSLSRVCKLCANKLNAGMRPMFCLGGCMSFNAKNDAVEALNSIEARLVSLRIPFGQIRELNYEGQLGLRGSIINVMSNVEKVQSSLPRFLDETASVLVQLKRKLEYRHSYMSGIVRPAITLKALQELAKKSLYIEHNVRINMQWATQAYQGVDASLEALPLQTHSEEDGNEIESDTLVHSLYTAQQVVDHNSSVVNIAPAEGSAPLSLFDDEFCEELSFPTLFFGEKRSYHQLCQNSFQKVAKWELLNADRRFRSNIENLFFKTMKIIIAKVRSSIWVRLRKAQPQGKLLHAKDVAANTNIETLLSSQIGYRDFEALRTSPDYKTKIKKNIFAMIRQLGPPTFFVTLSCAEKRWQPLQQCLASLNPTVIQDGVGNAATDVQRLVRADPITTARYYVHRFQALKRELKKEKIIVGQVEDFVFVTEFQHRGSQHDHGLIWVRDAPVHNQATDEEVVSFIDTNISVDKHQLPESLRDVQVHSHRRTCRKNRVECRFGFPKPPASRTMILYPLEEGDAALFQLRRTQHKLLIEKLKNLEKDNILSFEEWLNMLNMCEDTYIEVLRASITEAMVLLKREPKDIYTNNFNIGISTLWDANTDIQYVFNAFAAASYCTSYMTKNDTATSKAVQAILQQSKDNNSPTIERLRSLGNALINTQELTSQQAAYIALSLPLHSCSRQFQFINTNFASERTLLLKRKNQLEKLAAEDTNIFYDDVIAKYTKRPTRLHDLCLAEFATEYSLQKGHHKKMKRCKVLRFISYNASKDPEKYHHEMCLLFVPFTHDESTLLVGKTTTWKEVFDANIDIIALRKGKFTKVAHNLSEGAARKSFVSETSSSSIIGANHIYDIGIDMPPLRPHMRMHTQQQVKSLSNDDYYSLVRSLTPEQRLLHDDVLLRKRVEPAESLHLFLTGGAGTGKTFTLRAIIQGLICHYSKVIEADVELPSVLLMAYTGKAAFNVGGITIHSALSLPIKLNENSGMSSEKLNMLSQRYKNLQLVVFDEASLIGSRMIRAIDTRLRQIKHNHVRAFGGLDVIFCGDLCQASPVRDGWIFSSPQTLEGVLAQNYWQSQIKCYELHIVMRQDDVEFKEVLNKVRIGEQSTNDLAYLNSSFRRLPPSTETIPHLFFTNELKDKHNHLVFDQLTTEAYMLLARDKRHNNCSKTIKLPDNPQSTACLSSILRLKTGMIIELCAGNVDVLDGMVNGSDGVFHRPDSASNPTILWIEFFDQKTGAARRDKYRSLYNDSTSKTWTPIFMVTKEFQVGKNSLNVVTRTQFPVQPANARTIHRAQGLTMASLAFDPSKIKSHGLIYTALSRVKSPKNLYFACLHRGKSNKGRQSCPSRDPKAKKTSCVAMHKQELECV